MAANDFVIIFQYKREYHGNHWDSAKPPLRDGLAESLDPDRQTAFDSLSSMALSSCTVGMCQIKKILVYKPTSMYGLAYTEEF